MEETFIEGIFSVLFIIGLISTAVLFLDYYAKRQERREQEKNGLRDKIDYLTQRSESNSQKIDALMNICDEIRSKDK